MLSFAEALLGWYELHGRHDLPWQHPRSAYRVWLSEVMLQQTQVATVIPYFQRFVARFPDLASLAAASLDEVLQLWAGLGYYRRARQLHACAQLCVREHGATLPVELEALRALPGIGPSTAGAIAAQAYGVRAAILDANVQRVLSRQIALTTWPGTPANRARLWQEAEARLPNQRLADYTQALMDLGASVCRSRSPQCLLCPVSNSCSAREQGLVNEIPAKALSKVRPVRERHWLVLRDQDGRWLLERRPPSGIWGGLWAFPEGLDELELHHVASSVGAADLQSCGEAAWLRHIFTHFELRALPLMRRCTAQNYVADSALAWHTSTELAQLALPSPVRRLVERLYASTTEPSPVLPYAASPPDSGVH